MHVYGPYVGIRREFLCMHKISRRTQRVPTYECVWHRALNARSTTSRRAVDFHQRMTTNDKKSSYAGIHRAHTLICDGQFKREVRSRRGSISPKVIAIAIAHLLPVFSSPEPKARVSYCHSAPSVVRPSVVRPSVRPSVNFSHFRLLLQNRWMDFDETW